MYDILKIRKDFPILQTFVDGKPNTYLDTAASAQKPQCVIDKISRFYSQNYANVHRGMYKLSEEATAEYENARQIVAKFINSVSAEEIIFTRNATESINLVAASWAMNNLQAGDEILISEAEHHANLIPWQVVCEKTGCQLQVFKIADNGAFLPDQFLAKLSDKTKLVAVTAMSNVLGTVFPITEMTAQAHKIGAKVLVDACQLAVHQQIDVQDIGCDFLVFSGHKTYGPTGIGVLYGHRKVLETMPPYQFGGDMVEKVTYQKTTFASPPARFEAGTPAIVQAVGLGTALQYMMSLGLQNIADHEQRLVKYMFAQTADIKDFIHLGTDEHKGGVFSFQVGNIHPQDLAYVLAKEGVAVRIGHHCAEPLVNRLGYNSLARASFGLYTAASDIDTFINAIRKAQKFF